MSAFIVSQTHMHRVVTALIDSDLCPFYGSTFADELRDRPSSADRIGRKLFALNARAVRSRYSTRAEGYFDMVEADQLAAAYRWSPAFPPTSTPRLTRLCMYAKALDCLAYQCAEDGTTDDPLTQELRRYGVALAGQIVGELPQYRALPWGEEDSAAAA